MAYPYPLVFAFLCLLLLSLSCLGQEDVSVQDSLGKSSPGIKSSHLPASGICKNLFPVILYHEEPVQPTPVAVAHSPAPFLTVHGNILYDVNYQSNIDTPYAEQNIYRHTVQTYLDITLKNSYPFRVYLTNRFSNSRLFRDFSSVNFQFNQQQFRQLIKERMKEAVRKQLEVDTTGLYQQLKLKKLELSGLEEWLEAPDLAQRLTYARERLFWRDHSPLTKGKSDSLPGAGAVTTLLGQLDQLKSYGGKVQLPVLKLPSGSRERSDSLLSEEELLLSWQEKKTRLDSLKQEVALLIQRYNALKDGRYLDGATGTIDALHTPAAINSKVAELQMPDSSLPAGYRSLLAIRSFGIGRNLVDYSELLAHNITINGLQVEYNPSYYVAVASGSVDYRYRDFIVQQTGPRQHLNIIRGGLGLKEGNHLILSYYFGNRLLYNSGTSGSELSSRLVGYSLEGQYQVNRTTWLTGEIAKSSLPYYGTGDHSDPLLSDAFKFSERSNEAYSLKFNTLLPATGTRVTASYKYLGVNFQSFNNFSTGVAQSYWMAKVDQPFFKKHLNVTASLRTNETTNPLISNTFTSNTVFKSLQATWRKRNWPGISVGYYPSSQLSKLGDNSFYENIFYTLMGMVTHTYRYHQLVMNSTLMYSRFYNRSVDSGFVYFNTRNLLLNQSFSWASFTVQSGLSVSRNESYGLYVGSGACSYRLRRWLTVGGGVKYNYQSVYERKLLGYSSQATVHINKLGEFRFMMEKGFIPGLDKQLVSNNTGRFTYFRTF